MKFTNIVAENMIFLLRYVCVCVWELLGVGVCVRNLKPKAACWTHQQQQQQALCAGTSMANMQDIQPAALGFSQNGR